MGEPRVVSSADGSARAAAPDPSRAPRHAPSSRRRVVALLLASVLGLLVAEGVLRHFADHENLRDLLYMPGTRTIYDDCATLPELYVAGHYDREPFDEWGEYRLNAKALRTPDYELAKAPGTRRIVILGDSHSFSSGGIPDAKLWYRRMEDGLCMRGRDRFEVINLSVPAIGPNFELRMWQLEGSRLDPDLVILAFSVSNDLIEATGELSDRSQADEWARRSLVVRLVRNLAIVRAQTAEAQGEPPEDDELQGGLRTDVPPVKYDRTRPRFSPETYDAIVYKRSAISDVQRTQPFEAALQRVRQVFTELRRDTAALGAELVVMLIPAEHQVDAELLRRVVETRDRSLDDFDVERPQRELRALCAELAIPCVDTLDAIREKGRTTPMYRPRESHVNDIGHGLMAAELLKAMVEQGLVK